MTVFITPAELSCGSGSLWISGGEAEVAVPPEAIALSAPDEDIFQ